MVDNLLNMPVAMLVSSALRAGFRTLVRKRVPFAHLDTLVAVARPPAMRWQLSSGHVQQTRL